MPDKEELEGMPKDKNLGKHKSRYEVRAGVINEFDFTRNQGEVAEQERDRFARREEERRLREEETEAAAAEPQTETGRIQQLMEDAHEKVEERKEKAQGASRPTRSSVAKKGAKTSARATGKAAGKKGAAKKARAGGKGTAAAKSTKKAGAKKGAAKKSAAGKKGAAKKGRASKARKGGRTR